MLCPTPALACDMIHAVWRGIRSSFSVLGMATVMPGHITRRLRENQAEGEVPLDEDLRIEVRDSAGNPVVAVNYGDPWTTILAAEDVVHIYDRILHPEDIVKAVNIFQGLADVGTEDQ